MKQRILLPLLLFIATWVVFGECVGQTLAPTSVNAGGEVAEQEGVLLSYVLGDLVVQNFSDDYGNSLCNGFINASECSFNVLTGQSPTSSFTDIQLYPNPTMDFLTVSFSSLDAQCQSFEIFDNRGQIVDTKQFSNTKNLYQIDVSNYSPGIYLLRLYDCKEASVRALQFVKY